jgi:hypothetical protein
MTARERAPELVRHRGVRRPLALPDDLVDEVGDVALDGLESMRRMAFLSLVSPKRRSPASSTTGKILSR